MYDAFQMSVRMYSIAYKYFKGDEEKQEIRENLTNYCAKDTLNLYLIFKYFKLKES